MSTAAASSSTKMLSEELVIQLIGQALDVSPRNITLATKSNDIPEWDSMGILSILAALDRAQIACDMGNAAALQTVTGVVEVVRAAGRLQGK
jgi:acyl carrier protein